MQAASQMGAAMADLERSKPSKAGGFFSRIIQWQFRPFHPAEGLSRCSLAAQTLGHLTPEPTCHVREHGPMVTPEDVAEYVCFEFGCSDLQVLRQSHVRESDTLSH